MPNFHHNLMGIGPLCDHGCRVVFEQTKVPFFSKDSTNLLHGWCETTGSKLWRFSLCPVNHPTPPPDWSKGPTALNAHNLPSVVPKVSYGLGPDRPDTLPGLGEVPQNMTRR